MAGVPSHEQACFDLKTADAAPKLAEGPRTYRPPLQSWVSELHQCAP